MKHPINIFDVSIGSQNSGDQIIMHFSKMELLKIKKIKSHQLFFFPTHISLNCSSLLEIRKSEISIICGSNLLSGKHNMHNQWSIGFIDSLFLNNFLLFGTGWRTYEKQSNLYSKYLYKRLLSKNYLHSVRDSYTKIKLSCMGIKNVVNTGCPTTWGLTKEHCLDIPIEKSHDVIFTLTDYNRNPEKDKLMIKTLAENYNKLFFWAQGIYDLRYLRELNISEDIIFIDPNLDSFIKFLDSRKGKIDYVGTRLHGAILALNKYIRTILIGIDNRGYEMGSDININYIKRDNIQSLNERIKSKFKTDINIKNREINKWKNQFQSR